MRMLGILAAVLLGATLQFSSRVNLVEVYVTVTDRDGRPVSGLTREDFTLLEDDTPQAVSVFTAGEMGLSVAVALDRSFSMAGPRLDGMKRAAERFLRGLRPADQSMVIAVGSTVDVLAPLSSDRRPQIDALLGLDAWGSTSLHDAVIDALDTIQTAPGRRALVLVSDGVDRYSRASAAEVIERARRGDVQAYPIALSRNRPPFIVDLAAATGGRSLQVRDPKELDDALAGIAGELRAQYLLGYEPRTAEKGAASADAPPVGAAPAGAAPVAAQRGAEPGQGQWHRLRVQVKRKDVTVRARPGYWSR